MPTIIAIHPCYIHIILITTASFQSEEESTQGSSTVSKTQPSSCVLEVGVTIGIAILTMMCLIVTIVMVYTTI